MNSKHIKKKSAQLQQSSGKQKLKPQSRVTTMTKMRKTISSADE